MDRKRMQQYKDQILLLEKKDRETSKRISAEFDKLDKLDIEKEKKARQRILSNNNFEINYDHKNHFINIHFFDDEKEKETIISLFGDHFNKEEYTLNSPDPTFVTSLGSQNIFTGDNYLYWEDHEVFEVFYNHLMDFYIKIKEY
ncbi:MAG: hypothetical protein Unbinned2716contig1000_44 [Prokaryotic dsDNA virus sp.]|nr:MAG: hypothetical protein Unbinned2716contig1000_44 [Prokaryotic dsDNA virus sp.]|tara:strand:+ start:8016 stop:8447 length:432 start_codon:yes stop_codon:yes gene_type:complete